MPSASMSSAVMATKNPIVQSHSMQRWWPETRMFMTNADSSWDEGAGAAVWFGRAVSGQKSLVTTTRPVAGPKKIIHHALQGEGQRHHDAEHHQPREKEANASIRAAGRSAGAALARVHGRPTNA
jgi:hypothetical protein